MTQALLPVFYCPARGGAASRTARSGCATWRGAAAAKIFAGGAHIALYVCDPNLPLRTAEVTQT